MLESSKLNTSGKSTPYLLLARGQNFEGKCSMNMCEILQCFKRIKNDRNIASRQHVSQHFVRLNSASYILMTVNSE